ncbi:MAG: Rrf2 family transcriptional regulator [Gammaproteobacteria bacterium]|nr:Rrf2 family transcriptional regulator [Gammaproteobacteria bacterium]
MISQTSEYALRAAMYLVARPDDSPASAHEIADAIRVPVGYLQKILRMLARRDILIAQRGTNGGFALAKVPTAISVLDILKASDSEIQRITRCPLGIKGHTRLCPLHRLLDNEMARTEQTFAATTLADLLDGEGGIRAFCDGAGRLPLTVSVERDGKSKKSD